MSNQMTVSFPGGRRVTAHYDGFDIATDQSPDSGGEGAAPEPFDLFLASLATCAGIFALRFCQKRGLDTDGLRVTQTWHRDEDKKLVSIEVRVEVPEGFPDKYRKALARACDQCSVKRTMLNPPEMTVEVV